MDYPLALYRNRMALLAIVAGIVALLGGREGGLIARGVRNAALALLRPAEAAARRLIVIAARGLVLAPRPRPAIAAGIGAAGVTPGRGRPPAFRLIDARKRFTLRLAPPPPRGIPRVRSFGFGATRPLALPPPAPAPSRLRQPPAFVECAPVGRRLTALRRALGDLPRQARRLARWRGKAARQEKETLRRIPPQPLRPGRPPGLRTRSDRAVDDVLRECHALALDVLADTS